MRPLVALVALAACHAPTVDEPAADSPVLCDRVAGGGPDLRVPVVGLSEAHTGARLFGPEDGYATADVALAAALAGDLDAPDLDAYAAGFAEVCAADATTMTVGAASVTLEGAIAWVRPGSGAVVVPDEAEAIALDLRGLPADLDEAQILTAVAAALGTPVARADREVRVWTGAVDQVFAAQGVYHVEVERRHVEDLPAEAAIDRPLFVVNDATLAPAAAAVAVDLARSGRAAIIGHDVLTAVGEMAWFGVGDRGLLVRVADHPAWPDRLPAAVRTDDPEAWLAAADLSALPAQGVDGPHDRSAIAERSPFDEPVRWDADLGNQRAGLVIAHGMVRTFWRYFAVEGDTVDERLVEVLPSIDGADRRVLLRAIGRLGESLHDGHVFFGDYAGAAPAGYAAATFDHLGDGTPVVRGTAIDGLNRGDALVAVDGRPIDEVYEDLLAWHGAATEAYARELASRELVTLSSAVTWRVRDPEGVERDVAVAPGPAEALYALPWGPTRPSGTLADLGAPDVAYVNLDSGVSSDLSAVIDAIDAAEGASGLVVDMRGYPGVDVYAVARALVDGPFDSPRFLTTVASGPRARDVLDEQYPLSGTRRWSAPIALVVGPRTVSAAENLSQMLVGAEVVRVVGRNSAATNGNITGLVLPGGDYVSFTGMEVRNPDGSVFHGTGIVPEVVVPLRAADLRDGVDADLVAAIAAIR